MGLYAIDYAIVKCEVVCLHCIFYDMGEFKIVEANISICKQALYNGFVDSIEHLPIHSIIHGMEHS